MIQAAIAGLILLGIYKLMNEPDGDLVEWGATFAFILAPGFLIFLIVIGLGFFGVNPNFALFGYFLYFLIPFFWLKHYVEFSNGSAFKFAIVVPIVAIATEFLVVAVLSSLG